ncbi:MAG: hypothetical protein MI923_18185 [Phycisphaerales bacterium]|nr:hypothetical protein [Phycisphaerales bacterium]
MSCGNTIRRAVNPNTLEDATSTVTSCRFFCADYVSASKNTVIKASVRHA